MCRRSPTCPGPSWPKAASSSGRARLVHAGVSTFIPKPHTPFQWVPCDSLESIRAKQALLKGMLRGPGLKLSWTQPEETQLEAWLSRGDRRMGKVVLEAWRRGARFDAWQEHFNQEAWQQGFEAAGLDPAFYTHRERPIDETLPWDCIDAGVHKSFLTEDYLWSLQGRTRGWTAGSGVSRAASCPSSPHCAASIRARPGSARQVRSPARRTEVALEAPMTDESVFDTDCVSTRRRPCASPGTWTCTAPWSARSGASGLPLAYTRGFHPPPSAAARRGTPPRVRQPGRGRRPMAGTSLWPRPTSFPACKLQLHQAWTSLTCRSPLPMNPLSSSRSPAPRTSVVLTGPPPADLDASACARSSRRPILLRQRRGKPYDLRPLIGSLEHQGGGRLAMHLSASRGRHRTPGRSDRGPGPRPSVGGYRTHVAHLRRAVPGLSGALTRRSPSTNLGDPSARPLPGSYRRVGDGDRKDAAHLHGRWAEGDTRVGHPKPHPGGRASFPKLRGRGSAHLEEVHQLHRQAEGHP